MRMTDECREEQLRLVIRTAQLRARAEWLESFARAYSPDHHKTLRDELRQHELDLADFRRRCLKKGFR